jgi:starch phosphorylase
LSPKVLTIGFARRFATYKRSTMIFNDLERLDKLVNHPERPVQFIFAGKSHPADFPGQDLIREVYRVSQMDAFKGKIIILENYDIKLARYLVQGVDVWLNNPKRPLEASGTSGMKAALNGVVNFSVLDGWWEEGYDGKNGWEIASNFEAPWEVQERENTKSLYETLENEIAPLYYDQSDGLPLGWIARMKHCIQTLAPEYNTDRMVQDYTNKFYIKTSERFTRFNENENENALRFADFKSYMVEHWYRVRILHVNDQVRLMDPGYKEIEVKLTLGSIHVSSVIVEAVYHEERDNQWFPIRVPLEYQSETANGEYIYSGRIPDYLIHGPHYLVRVRPMHPEFAQTFEMSLVAKS